MKISKVESSKFSYMPEAAVSVVLRCYEST